MFDERSASERYTVEILHFEVLKQVYSEQHHILDTHSIMLMNTQKTTLKINLRSSGWLISLDLELNSAIYLSLIWCKVQYYFARVNI